MLLLVLRGLTGTAMAAQFVPERPAQAVQASAAAHHAAHGMQADQGAGAAGVGAAAQAACHSAAGDGCAAHEHSPACAACDICHSALLAPPALVTPPVPTASQVRPTAATPFASAPAALAIKPPIL